MAAGLGFKTFTTGEVLTAADTNGYLMQGINVFASTAARDAAITSPQEGQFAFTKDTNGLWYYDGAAWVASGATGDIEGVTAGVGITGGGTSGTVTITNDMATTITASGDIVVGTGSGTYDNLPIGTTNQVLTADTTVSPYKVKWATPSGSTPTVNWVRLTSGTSWSVPAGIKSATIWTIGGGGGGGSARGDGNKYGGGGGGAGGLQSGTFDLSSVAGSTIAYAIGAGGAGGAQTTGSGNTGTNGGNTTFGTSGQAWYLSATGGGGGKGGNGQGNSGGCGGGNGGASSSGAAGGGGGGIGGNGDSARSKISTDSMTHGTQGGSAGYGGFGGTDGTAAGLGGLGMFINNYGVGGGGVGGCLQGNNFTNGSTIYGAAQSNAGADGNNSTGGTGAGGPGGTNGTASNTGYAGGAGGAGVIFIQYLS
jgi:hypothetical protein